MPSVNFEARPHPTRPPSRPPSSFTPCTTATPPWAGGSASAGNPHIKRNYSQIIADASADDSSSILIQFKLTKVAIDGKKPYNLSFSQFGEFLFDVLKVNPDSCLGIDLSTGRYDTRELQLKTGTDISAITSPTTPHMFKGHEITATLLSSQVTRVTFKQVPLSVPDEEILHLCCHYGELLNGEVHRESVTIGGANRYTLTSSTRWVEVKLFPGKTFHNYYWLGGPLPGDVGRRVTVLHPNQPRQCGWCFKYPPSSSSTPPTLNVCRGGGDGKTCKSQNTPRAKMSSYIEYLKSEGYISLRDQYLAPHVAFPSLQGDKPIIYEKVDAADISGADDEEEDDEGAEGTSEAGALPDLTVKSSSSEEVVKPQKEPLTSPFIKPLPNISPGKPGRESQNIQKFEKPMAAWVRDSDPVDDDYLNKYALLALNKGVVVLDAGGDPEKVQLTLKGESKFLQHSQSSIGGNPSRQGRFDTMKTRVWDLLKDPSVQANYTSRAGGGKKEHARLHSESSPGGDQSQSKNQRTASPPKL